MSRYEYFLLFIILIDTKYFSAISAHPLHCNKGVIAPQKKLGTQILNFSELFP